MQIWTRAKNETRKIVEKNWAKSYRIIAAAKNRWMLVRGPMTATIATLIDIGIKPVVPCRWITKDGETVMNFDHEPGVSCFRILDHVQGLLEEKQWKAAGDHHNGEGLEEGISSITPASKAYSNFVKNG